MGLIGTWLNAMVNGISLTLLSPLAFLARPECWLWAIHAQRATLSPAPNFACLFAAWTIALLALGPIIALLFVALPAGRPVRTLSRLVARIVLFVSGCRVEVQGAEHLPRKGPVVLVANHTSYADTPVLLAALPVDFVFVVMKETLSWRVIGAVVRRGRHLTVDRWHPRQSVADVAPVEQRLRAGDSVLFFPEGGLSYARGLRPFRLGAFEVAAATGASIVPIALRGSREILPENVHLPHPRKVTVWIGEPMRATAAGWRGIVDLRDGAANAIAAHCGEPRLHATTGISTARAPGRNPRSIANMVREE